MPHTPTALSNLEPELLFDQPANKTVETLKEVVVEALFVFSLHPEPVDSTAPSLLPSHVPPPLWHSIRYTPNPVLNLAPRLPSLPL